MKTYFLEAVSDADAARRMLSFRLPGQVEPWLLMTEDGSDVIAYLDIDEAASSCEGPYVVYVNISGRHYEADPVVIDLLRSLQRSLGGMITDDFDNVL